MTNREIAQKLGISPAALSLIINHKPGVSDSTRDRVLTELQEMGCDNLIKKAPAVMEYCYSQCFFISYKSADARSVTGLYMRSSAVCKCKQTRILFIK